MTRPPPATETPFTLLTLKEVARRMATNERTVRELIQLGRLPATKFGAEWKVTVRDLDEYREQHEGDGDAD